MIEAGLLADIDREWDALGDQLVHTGQGGGDQARDVLRSVAADPDAVLGGLIAAAQAGETLAGRIVVQAMLPKLILQARRDRSANLGDYLAQLWLRIGTYPLQRRPRRIAANLALDTLKAVRREHSPHPVRPVELAELERRLPPSSLLASGDDLSARRVLRGARRLGLIDELTSHVLAAVYVEGLSSRDAAARFGCSADSIRWRCSRALRRLAGHADKLAVA